MRLVPQVSALLVSALLMAACTSPSPPTFTKVELAGAPVAIAADGPTLLIGVRRDGQPQVPALLRRAAGGAVTEIPTRPASPYGQLATWQSLATADGAIVAIGGERGGAHGNVRWSVWSGTAAGVAEQPQAFSTFGGWGAGDLVAAAVTPVGPALVGTWESAQVGLDVATWTASGDTWTRQSSAGTAMESAQTALGFPTAATVAGQGILIAGWHLTDHIEPVVWQSASGATGWTKTTLPDAGATGTALAAHCSATTCTVAGQVDGKLALWHFDGHWQRMPDVPAIAVSDRDTLSPPFEVNDTVSQAVTDGGRVKIVQGGTVHEIDGPTGTVTATAVVGNDVYLVTDANQLWHGSL